MSIELRRLQYKSMDAGTIMLSINRLISVEIRGKIFYQNKPYLILPYGQYAIMLNNEVEKTHIILMSKFTNITVKNIYEDKGEI